MIAVVKVISPILVGDEWVRSGEVTIDVETAKAHESAGLVDIVSIDGDPVVWCACCNSH